MQMHLSLFNEKNNHTTMQYTATAIIEAQLTNKLFLPWVM